MNSAKEENISTITKLSELLIETKLKRFDNTFYITLHPLFAQHKILKINQMCYLIIYIKLSCILSIVQYGLLFILIKLIVIDAQSYTF